MRFAGWGLSFKWRRAPELLPALPTRGRTLRHDPDRDALLKLNRLRGLVADVVGVEGGAIHPFAPAGSGSARPTQLHCRSAGSRPDSAAGCVLPVESE